MNIQSLKLYHFPGSRSARVRWALHETYGDDFALESLALMQGVQYTPEFLAINPNHAVPVLEICWGDGSVQHMLESVAMVEWLADAYPDKQLAPAATMSRERADYLQQLHFGGVWMDAMLWQIRMHQDLLPADEADPRSVDRAMDKLRSEVEPQLLQQLSTADYMCGPEFSAADIVLGHNVLWARVYGLCQGPPFDAYVSRLAARAAFARAFEDAPRMLGDSVS
jgi:glutathione S-transferase